MRVFIALGLCLLTPLVAMAEDRRPSHCISLVRNVPGLEVLYHANLSTPLNEYTVQLGYIDHSMFVLRTRAGHTVVTDYAGYLGSSSFLPDVVTMNKGHTSHWTAAPNPAIPHVLRGWTPTGAPADHFLDLGDLLIRSVSTDIRSWNGREPNGNAIFVFEAEGLCIGHLGHLHHEPTPEQYAAIGRLDVVMAAVDGGLTLDHPTMVRVLKQFRSSVVIPMHWFGRSTLERFLSDMASDFQVDRREESFMDVSLHTLPKRPTVVVLEPRLIQNDDH